MTSWPRGKRTEEQKQVFAFDKHLSAIDRFDAYPQTEGAPLSFKEVDNLAQSLTELTENINFYGALAGDKAREGEDNPNDRWLFNRDGKFDERVSESLEVPLPSPDDEILL